MKIKRSPIHQGDILAAVSWYLNLIVICLIFVFIEMLDKLIAYIMCWYQTLYQVEPVVWTNRITTRFCIRWSLSCELTASQLVVTATRSDTDSQDRLDLIQSIVPTHYTCNGYVSWFCYLEVHILFWVEEVETLYIHLRIYSQTTQSFGKLSIKTDSWNIIHYWNKRILLEKMIDCCSFWVFGLLLRRVWRYQRGNQNP